MLSSFNLYSECNYRLENNSVKIWEYSLNVEAFGRVLESFSYEADELSPISFQIKGKQLPGRYLKYYRASYLMKKNKKVIHQANVERNCYMVNCSVYDAGKTLEKVLRKMKKDKFVENYKCD